MLVVAFAAAVVVLVCVMAMQRQSAIAAQEAERAQAAARAERVAHCEAARRQLVTIMRKPPSVSRDIDMSKWLARQKRHCGR